MSHPARPASPRFASVDALRGMAVAAMIFVNNPGSWDHVWWPFEHAAWHGCTPTDLIFPAFLFIVGVSLALATGPVRDSGHDGGPLLHKLLVRAVRIIALGLLLHTVAHLAMGTPHWRLPGVLQRIGLCVALAAAVVLSGPPRRWKQWSFALLAGYSALLWLGRPLTPEHNPETWLDSRWLGALAYQFDAASGRAFDPEGPVGTLGALATTLIGALAGEALRQGRRRDLWVGAAAGLAGGLWLSWAWPWNKSLWTPSFTLWTAGWAALALAVAHEFIDRRGAPARGRALGSNAITAYAGAWLMTCLLEGTGWGAWLYARGFAWMVPATGPLWPSHLWALAGVLIWWGVARALMRRGLFIKI